MRCRHAPTGSLPCSAAAEGKLFDQACGAVTLQISVYYLLIHGTPSLLVAHSSVQDASFKSSNSKLSSNGVSTIVAALAATSGFYEAIAIRWRSCRDNMGALKELYGV